MGLSKTAYFPGSDHISKDYYYSDLNCDKEIALGFITYSSVESKALEYKDFKLNYNTECNKKNKDSIDQVNKNTELNRIKKMEYNFSINS